MNIYLSMPLIFHIIKCPPGSFMLLQLSRFHSFKKNITYHMFLFIYFSIGRHQNLSCILVFLNCVAIKCGTFVSFDTNFFPLTINSTVELLNHAEVCSVHSNFISKMTVWKIFSGGAWETLP